MLCGVVLLADVGVQARETSRTVASTLRVKGGRAALTADEIATTPAMQAAGVRQMRRVCVQRAREGMCASVADLSAGGKKGAAGGNVSCEHAHVFLGGEGGSRACGVHSPTCRLRSMLRCHQQSPR